MNTEILFTVLPHGRSGNQLKLSVFVTPKFVVSQGGVVLAGTILQDWPSILSQATFSVEFVLPEHTRVATLDPDPAVATGRFDSTLWSKVFPANAVLIDTYQSKRYNGASFSSFSTHALHKDITKLYADLAAASPDRPSVRRNGTDDLSTRVRDVSTAVQGTAAAGSALKPTSASAAPIFSGAAIRPNDTTVTKEYVRGAVFFGVNEWRKEQNIERLASADVTSPKLKFNEILGALGDHPALMRRLGLVVDLIVELPARAPTSGTVSVKVAIPGVEPAMLVSPKTLYVVTDNDFFACFVPDSSRKSVHVIDGVPVDIGSSILTGNGMVPLNDKAYLLSHLDIDHAASEVIDFSQKTAKTLDDKVTPTDGNPSMTVGLPALRTVGFGIHNNDRERVVAPRLNRPYVYEKAPAGLAFIADELVRGYRIDVSTDGGPWKSLCWREVKVTAGGPSETFFDEGYIKNACISTTSAKAEEKKMFNIHESLFQWDGWSLVAQRPGLTIKATPGVGKAQTETLTPVVTSAAGHGMAIDIDIKARAESLPKLRFGHAYQFRARAVDLAGNDLGRGISSGLNPIADHATDPQRLARYEPVGTPTLVLQNEVSEGESVEHLVIRSNPWGAVKMGADTYAIEANKLPRWDGKLKGPMSTYGATSERHVAPPKASFQMAELHGKFDNMFPGGMTAENVRRLWAVATKEEGTFYDAEVVDTGVYPPKRDASGCQLVTPPPIGAPAGAVGSTLPMPKGRRRGDPLLPEQYVLYRGSEVTLPYLPDPNAAGIAIHGIPGGTVTRSFTPRAQRAWPELGSLRLVLTEASSLSVWGTDGNTASAGNAVTIGLPPARRLKLTYSSSIVDPNLMELAPPNAGPAIQKGQHALLSPPRELTVVHAVQQPRPPELRTVNFSTPPRAEGETSAKVGGSLTVYGDSTGHVELVGTWSEILDVVNDSNVDPTTIPQTFTSTACSFQVPEDPLPKPAAFPADAALPFGDTKRRDVTYKAVATTRFREYFPPSITADSRNITNESNAILRIIPSSARPPVPKVLYAVPTFQWAKPTALVSKRAGGGLRVYVDRGWFASGADERLAVILAAKPHAVPSNAKPPLDAVNNPELVSVWGNDPIWYAKEDLTMLDETSFTFDESYTDQIVRDVETAEGLGSVTVATFRPKFHAERKLWYFDITINPQMAYFPFVRLALARFQPFSTQDLRLSRIVRADFAQLAADRTSTIVPGTNGTFRVSVDGVSGSNLKLDDQPIDAQTGRWPGAASGRTVTAEFQESLTGKDELDWRLLGTPVVLDPYAVTGSSSAAPLVQFRGNMLYPRSRANANAKHRIVIREYEIFATDDQSGVAKGIGVVKIGEAPAPYAQRLVYVDTVEINP
jgi:hypothetical protein